MQNYRICQGLFAKYLYNIPVILYAVNPRINPYITISALPGNKNTFRDKKYKLIPSAHQFCCASEGIFI